jgi:hypothetical protein
MPVDDPEIDLGHGQSDRPLGFHWKTPTTDLIRFLGVPIHSETQRRAVNSIVTEAVLAADEGRWVSYSRHKPFYSGQQRYHGTSYTYTVIIKAIDGLLLRGWIREKRTLPGHRGWQSRFCATPKLIELWDEAPHVYDLHEIICLKDAAGNLIDYDDNRATLRLRHELRDINDQLATISLDLPGPGIARTSKHWIIGGAFYRPQPPALRRVFNRSSFNMGGRGYGWWQSLPKQRRAVALINGEPVAEPDFEQMHTAILYAEKGLRSVGDAYETGEFPRSAGKLAFNVALNAASRQGAIAALMNKRDWAYSGPETSRLLDSLTRRHSAIKDALHSDQGIRLMRKDSDITIGATKDCLKAGIPVLPIHDSMLCLRQHEGLVAEKMEAAAARHLGAINPCSVRRSRPTVPQMPSTLLSPLLLALSEPFNLSSLRNGRSDENRGITNARLQPIDRHVFPASFSIT